MRIILLSLFLSVFSILFAQKQYHLQGTIGEIPIYMYIEDYSATDDDGNIMGRYFYQTSLKDIVLRGTVSNSIFKLTVESGVDEVSETFSLNKEGDLFEGTWTNNKGKSVPVRLKSINVNGLNNRYKDIFYIDSLKSKDPYNYARTSFVELKRDSVSTTGGKSFVWLSEKHCSAPFFRLGNGFEKKQVEILNPILDGIHFENIVSQLSCSSNWEYSKGDGIYYSISINYLDNNLLGFEVFSSWYCGGAHPDFGGVGYLFNLNTGSNSNLNDVYDLTPEIIYELLTEQYHFEKPADNDDDCDYTDLEVWQHYRWSINKDGVNFTPYFFRSARACEEPFLVPYAKLEQYKKESFLYNLGRN